MKAYIFGLFTCFMIFFPNWAFCGGDKIVITKEELSGQRNMDLETIEALKRNGSDLSKAHILEHHFYVFSEKSAKRLSEKGISLGYKTSKIQPGNYEGNSYWYFDLIKPTIPEIDIVIKETTLMLKLAKEFDAEYDGWGTNVVE